MTKTPASDVPDASKRNAEDSDGKEKGQENDKTRNEDKAPQKQDSKEIPEIDNQDAPELHHWRVHFQLHSFILLSSSGYRRKVRPHLSSEHGLSGKHILPAVVRTRQ